jgi:glycosyltransferase involved in cell wall biosynthesis
MQVTFGMGVGGMERVIMDLCRYVDPERFRFSICCISVRGPLADQMEEEGIPVIFCEKQSRLNKYFRGLELGRIFRQADVQVLHTHHTPAFIDSVVGARLAGVPILINTDHCKDYPIQRHWMLLEKAASFWADEIVAVSRHTREELIRYEGIAGDKVSVIYNGINVRMTRKAAIHELRGELGLAPGEKVVGTVARLEDQKDLDLLLASIPYVVTKFPNTRIVIVGGGSKEADLKQQAARLGVSDRVVFTGWRPDAIDLMQLFDCFVLSSRFEGMPMVLLEAMALSKPIVATAVGGVPEVVQEGYNGFLVRDRDAECLGSAISHVLADGTLSTAMGKNGRALYEKHFTAEAMASAYQDLYSKYLHQKKVIVE